jgi:hypothetical protein
MISQEEVDLAARLRTALYLFNRNRMDAANGLGAFKQLLTDGYADVRVQINREGNCQITALAPEPKAPEPTLIVTQEIIMKPPVLEESTEEEPVENIPKPKRKKPE